MFTTGGSTKKVCFCFQDIKIKTSINSCFLWNFYLLQIESRIARILMIWCCFICGCGNVLFFHHLILADVKCWISLWTSTVNYIFAFCISFGSAYVKDASCHQLTVRTCQILLVVNQENSFKIWSFDILFISTSTVFKMFGSSNSDYSFKTCRVSMPSSLTTPSTCFTSRYFSSSTSSYRTPFSRSVLLSHLMQFWQIDNHIAFMHVQFCQDACLRNLNI